MAPGTHVPPTTATTAAEPAAPFPAPPWAPGRAPVPPPRRRTGRVVAAVAGTTLAVAALAGGALLLFGEPTLDTAVVEERIVTETGLQAGAAATDVDCPTGVTAEAGGAFTCTAQLDGQPVTYTVRQQDAEGNVRFQLDDEIVRLDDVEQMLADQLATDHGLAVTAACGTDERRVLVDGTRTPLPCVATNVEDASDTLALVVAVQADGSITYAEA
ncbi:DUF4333 domain-containing protein [Modestobacter sp. L9-4]|uniref:DUF4333 domain-containing protein n=1 Tax=Modestobacter sp. L9-4 TaxID=2851567 RepID=UPI001C798CC4|nr:DUF4333 domain-containing protein [Modestobacter sp. L9-4]QXG76175.1 DUF4333 domain-containing protein [Modestobacter sp. L9-4]